MEEQLTVPHTSGESHLDVGLHPQRWVTLPEMGDAHLEIGGGGYIPGDLGLLYPQRFMGAYTPGVMGLLHPWRFGVVTPPEIWGYTLCVCKHGV